MNSSHLKPAALLDSILLQFTRDASEGELLFCGIPSEIKEHHLQLIRDYLINDQIQKYSFLEFYIVHTNALVELGKYFRMKSTVNLHLVEQIYFYQRENCHTKKDLINATCNLFT